MLIEDDEGLRRTMNLNRSLAVVGMKTTGPAWSVPEYLRTQGYSTVAVNPKYDEIGGIASYASVGDLPQPVDMIVVFRRPEVIGALADEVLALPWRPNTVWMQLGIRNDEAAARLVEAGIHVVQDHCLAIEHPRLGRKMTPVSTAPYLEQLEEWPATGRHIMAQYDDESVVVYQAYKPQIARWAVANQRFGGSFKFTRMSWIKPNFLWMMYRCGWATKQHQEMVLAVRIAREGFEQLLRDAVHSNYVEPVYGTEDAWKEQLRGSEVRLQWDPDHAPNGSKQARRAIQLGLRGEVLQRYATDWIVNITDVTPLVKEQHAFVDDLAELHVPVERPYLPSSQQVIDRLGIGDIGLET